MTATAGLIERVIEEKLRLEKGNIRVVVDMG